MHGLRKATVILALGASCAGPLILSGCASGTRERPVAQVDPSAGAIPRGGGQASKEELRILTPEQQVALDLRHGVADGNPVSVALAQRMLLGAILTTSFNTVFVEREGLPETWSNFKPLLAVWPLTAEGTAWPVLAISDSTTFPRAVVGPAVGGAPFSLVLTASDWDDAPTDVFGELLTPEWARTTGQDLLTQPAVRGFEHARDAFPADINLSVLAHGVLTVLTDYVAVTGLEPATPGEAFSRLRMGVITDADRALRDAYPRREFWRSADGSRLALLLEGEGHTRYLSTNTGAKTGDFSVIVWGYTDSGQRMIDRFLGEMQLWAPLDEALEGAPRVAFPDAPTGATVIATPATLTRP